MTVEKSCQPFSFGKEKRRVRVNAAWLKKSCAVYGSRMRMMYVSDAALFCFAGPNSFWRKSNL